MEIIFLTTISLVWLVYTFLFADADKQIIDAFNRLKFALSINRDTHGVNPTLLQVHGCMGIPEIISYGEGMSKVDPMTAKNVEVFARKYLKVENYKRILIWNLFILTTHAVIYNIFFYFSSPLIIQVHIIISLFLGAFFYWYTQKELSTLIFSEVQF